MAQVNLKYLKGVRTRYVNILNKEVQVGVDLLNLDVSSLTSEELKGIQKNVSECKSKIDTYVDKLSSQSEKLAQALGDTDDELTQQIMDDDSTLTDSALALFYKLKIMDESLREKQLEEKEKSKTQVFDESGSLERFCDFQTKLQQDFFTQQQQRSEQQMKLQQDMLQSHVKRERDTQVKLPKLDIVSFNGNKLYWVEFWDSFKSAVHNNDRLSPVDKFNYLKGKLTGEARSAIAGLSLSNENYDVAIRILQERFGETQEIIDLHYKRLLSLYPAKNTTDSLRSFMDGAEKHLRSLEVLKEDIDQHIFVSMIRNKLPSDVLFQLELLKGADNKWTVQKLRDVLKQYIVSREKSDKAKPVNSSQQASANRGPRYNATDGSKSQSSQNKGIYSAGVFVATEKKASQPSKRCRYCEMSHWSDECHKFKTVEERKKELKGSCYRCLKGNHLAKDCKSSKECVYCGVKNVHHRSLCNKRFQKAAVKDKETVHLSQEAFDEDTKQDTTQDEVSLLSCDETVFVQTALAEISGNDGKKERVRLLLDSGSHRTYISSKLAQRLGLKEEREQTINVITFGSETTKVVKTKSTTLKLKLLDGSYMVLTANIVSKISGNLHRSVLTSDYQKRLSQITRNLRLADTIPTEKEVGALDLLIGSDYYLDIIEAEKIKISEGLYLVSSKLGWILSGRASSNLQHDSEDINMLILSQNRSTNNDITSEFESVVYAKANLEDFWNIETIGVHDKADNSDDEKAMTNFKETVKRENGRYQVKWPWKDESRDLPENRGLALGRLKSLVTRIQKQPELMSKYDDIIQDQLEKGIIEKVDRNVTDGTKHYIPHHVVITPQKTTTKLRIVYDASAKGRQEHKSLNECLYRGPVLLRDLCGILIRFRLSSIGIVSDIEKAFLQVELQKSERDVTRFLWFKNCEEPIVNENYIQELRFCRVPFGVVSSPFLLAATIETHLETYGSALANQLKENIYVDNVITGTNSVPDAISLYKEGKAMFRDANMNLREWSTNSMDVNNVIPECDKAKDEEVKVLGHTWNTKTDTLSIQDPNKNDNDLSVTKRNVLKQIASVYDPLGMFTPVTIRGKALLQQVWRKHLDWDDKLDEEDTLEWLRIKDDLSQLSKTKIQRCVILKQKDGEVVYKLVCFCDASTKAYATSIYLSQTGNVTKTDLIFSKGRLAPLKGMTIPKLELMAVLIGVRCLEFVRKEINLPVDDIIVFTDSQCVLQWIQSNKQLPVFVSNRVREINEHTGFSFRYVNTKDNTADIASRGCNVKRLNETENWWHGPQWLLLSQDKWPNTSENIPTENNGNNFVLDDKHESTMTNQTTACITPFGIDEDKFSSFTHVIRVTAWCKRFVDRLKGIKNNSVYLTNQELNEAEIMWIKHVQMKHLSDVSETIKHKKQNNLVKQLDLFVDRCGLIRCGGRLKYAEFSEATRFPILLPKHERITNLLIEKIHKKLLHSGTSQTLSEIRQEYWIPQGRSVVRSVLKRCKTCRRFDGGAYKLPPMAPLPKGRVSKAVPFSKVGIDYFGPLQTKEGKDSSTKKVWACLFTCLITRAIHLELVSDMSAQSFLSCLRRFIATKGTPSEIVSDNAQQFKLSSDVVKTIWSGIIKSECVQNYVSGENIQWTYIIELAPWMGGFYERMVGLVKRALRKTIGRKILSNDQLTTLLKECESVVNSRPLVYIGDDLKSSIALTPRHFISLNPSSGIPEMESESEEDPEYNPYESSADKLLKIWKKGQRILDTFWQIWRNEYLLSLRERMQNKHKSSRIQSTALPSVNDVVIIKDDLPRGYWRLGKLSKLNVSKDGHIRSAEVTTATGKILKRPLNLLFPIEVEE